jgi:cytochrome c
MAADFPQLSGPARCSSITLIGACMTRNPLGHGAFRIAAFLVAAFLVAQTANAALDNTSAQAMMQKDGCAACHSIDKKIVGPAYQDVAAKYKGDKDALAKLSDKVKKGGVGVWGQIPMPPNAQVSDADIKDLVSWILTLKK